MTVEPEFLFRNLIRLQMSWLLIFVVTSMPLDCRGDEHRYKAEIASALTDLRTIGMLLNRHSLELNKPAWQLMACAPDGSKDVEIVSAERVLLPLFMPSIREESFLTSWIYEQKVAPTNPNATKRSEKWGSSYNTWCMSNENWQSAEMFVWYNDGTFHHASLQFPWVWDKRPDLYGGRVQVLISDGSSYSVHESAFTACLEHAQKWLRPKSINIEEVLTQLGASAPHVRANALTLLGARKETKHISEIMNALQAEDLMVKHAAEGALVMIGEGAVPALIRQTNSPALIVRSAAISALRRIGGPASVAGLGAFVDDPSPSIRMGVVRALAGVKDEAAVPFLKKAAEDLDPAVRMAAEEALAKR
jgi:hypothetical protein